MASRSGFRFSYRLGFTLEKVSYKLRFMVYSRKDWICKYLVLALDAGSRFIVLRRRLVLDEGSRFSSV